MLHTLILCTLALNTAYCCTLLVFALYYISFVSTTSSFFLLLTNQAFDRASGKVRERLKKSAILAQKCEITDFGQIVYNNAILLK